MAKEREIWISPPKDYNACRDALANVADQVDSVIIPNYEEGSEIERAVRDFVRESPFWVSWAEGGRAVLSKVELVKRNKVIEGADCE